MQVHIETRRQEPSKTYTRADGTQVTIDPHTVEVTINGDRRRVRCGGIHNGWMSVWDLAIRFSHGAKVWPGSATYWIESGNVNNIRPNIDKRGHFILAGYMEDFKDKPVRSVHNAVA